jgi:hypothetical protein
MKIERSPQGISFQCANPMVRHLIISGGYLLMVLAFPTWIGGYGAFFQGFLADPTSAAVAIAIQGMGVLLLTFFLWKTVHEGLRECMKMEVQSGLFEFSTRLLTLQLQNMFGRKQVLNCNVGDVQDLDLFYSNVSDEGDGYCGLRLKLAQFDTPLYLSRGGLPFEKARSIAQELTTHFNLPEKPPFHGYTSSNEGDLKSRILEKTEYRLVYRMDYGAFMIKLYALLGLFATGFLVIPALVLMDESAHLLFKVGVLGVGSIPMGLLLWLLQNVGFYETWTWERSARQFRIDRTLLIGIKKQTFSSQGVKAVVMTTQPGSLTTPTYYQVGLNSPTLNLGQSAGSNNPVRTIYSHQNLREATDFAAELRYYLNLGDALS